MVTPRRHQGWITEKLPCDYIELDATASISRR